MKKLLIAAAILASVNVQANTPEQALQLCKNIVIDSLHLQWQMEEELETWDLADGVLRPSIEANITGYSHLMEGNRLLWSALECELIYELYSEQFVWEGDKE